MLFTPEKKKVDTKKKIFNPYRKYDIGLDKPISTMDLYLTNRNKFNEIAEGENSDFRLSQRLLKFFGQVKVSGKSYNNDIAVLKTAWEVYNIKQQRKNVRDTTIRYGKTNIDKTLLEQTVKGKLKWEVVLETCKRHDIDCEYRCNFDHKQWTFSVIGFTKSYDDWHFHYELQWTDKNGDKGTIDNACYRKIYEAIQKKTEVDNSYAKVKQQSQRKKERKINSGDFVVRTNLFKCFYKDHLVEEIIAVVDVVNKKGEVLEKRVPGAYCPKCRCYFLLESQYKKLKECGILLCQVIEGESYYKKGDFKSLNMAKESLLMQNGYNVKANNGLTDKQRQIILENIMNNRILTPHAICSYLEMFIAQKKNMPQYGEAVLKWEKDRSFVLSYKNEYKKKVKIQSIKER